MNLEAEDMFVKSGHWKCGVAGTAHADEEQELTKPHYYIQTFNHGWNVCCLYFICLSVP
jgi:hypothetical protein